MTRALIWQKKIREKELSSSIKPTRASSSEINSEYSSKDSEDDHLVFKTCFELTIPSHVWENEFRKLVTNEEANSSRYHILKFQKSFCCWHHYSIIIARRLNIPLVYENWLRYYLIGGRQCMMCVYQICKVWFETLSGVGPSSHLGHLCFVCWWYSPLSNCQ